MDLGTSKGKVMPGNCLIKNVENLGRVGYTCEIRHFSFHGLNYRTGEWNFSWRPFLCASGLWTEPDLRTLNINYRQWRKQVKSNFKHSQGALAPLEQGRETKMQQLLQGVVFPSSTCTCLAEDQVAKGDTLPRGWQQPPLLSTGHLLLHTGNYFLSLCRDRKAPSVILLCVLRIFDRSFIYLLLYFTFICCIYLGSNPTLEYFLFMGLRNKVQSQKSKFPEMFQFVNQFNLSPNTQMYLNVACIYTQSMAEQRTRKLII